MKKLSKDKRNKLILVALATAAVVAGLWILLVNTRLARLKEISDKISASEQRQYRMKLAVDNAVQIEADLKEESKLLAELENNMASGDLYLWQINMIKRFKGTHRVEIPEINPGPQADCSLLPKFPYRQVTVSIGGTANYHDFGKFLAEFENTYRHMRVQNLQLYPIAAASSSDKEKIAFKMEIVTLTKHGSS